MPKGMVCPGQVNETFVLSYDAFDFDKFNTLPKFIKEKMEKSVEFKKISDVVHSNEHTKKLASMNDNDDLPF
jgi:ferritin